MVVSIRLPESNSTYSRKRRYSKRFSRKLLVAAVLALVLLFWFLDGHGATTSFGAEELGARPIGPEDMDLGTEKVGLKTLVIITCHAIWLGGTTAGEDEKEWAIIDFQKGETRTFIKHIEAGISSATQDPESLLIFSGGETKASAGPRSESDSYFSLAVARNLIPSPLLARTTTEENAMDSYQNVLFSICRFHEVTGNYPTSITVISHEFKRDRFRLFHRGALRYPEESFKFVGVDPEWAEGEATVKGQILEHERATRDAWEADLYACTGSGELREKRKGRNPMRRFNAYSMSCPELVGLLGWCGIEEGVSRLYPGRLPWLL